MLNWWDAGPRGVNHKCLRHTRTQGQPLSGEDLGWGNKGIVS